MSLNGINHTGILPQFARNAAGQIFMIASPHTTGQQPFYYLPQFSLDTTNAANSPQAPRIPRPLSQPLAQPLVQPLPPPVPQLQQIQANVPQPSPVPTPQSQPLARSKDETNAKIRTIKEKTFLSHYIEGQLILETPIPLTQLKFKTKKEKKRRVSNQPQQLHVAQESQQTSSISPKLDLIPQPQAVATKVVPKLEPVNDVLANPQSMSKDDVRNLRNRMCEWSVDDVVKFIESHEDIRQYSVKFADDEVDGKALLLMIDRNLNLQMLASMFKHGPAMKIEAVLSNYKLTD